MQTVVIASNRKQMVFTALGGFAFVILGLVMLLGRVEPANLFVRIIGGVSVIFFGACSFFAVRRLASPRPALTLTDDGLEDTSGGVTLGFVAWDDITKLSFWMHQGQRGLCVHLRDPQKYLAFLPPLKRNALRANVGLVETPMVIMQSNITVPLETLKESIEARIAWRNGHTWAVDPLQPTTINR